MWRRASVLPGPRMRSRSWISATAGAWRNGARSASFDPTSGRQGRPRWIRAPGGTSTPSSTDERARGPGACTATSTSPGSCSTPACSSRYGARRPCTPASFPSRPPTGAGWASLRAPRRWRSSTSSPTPAAPRSRWHAWGTASRTWTPPGPSSTGRVATRLSTAWLRFAGSRRMRGASSNARHGAAGVTRGWCSIRQPSAGGRRGRGTSSAICRSCSTRRCTCWAPTPGSCCSTCTPAATGLMRRRW